jgi:hypothetical protein
LNRPGVVPLDRTQDFFCFGDLAIALLIVALHEAGPDANSSNTGFSTVPQFVQVVVSGLLER